ncbi:MAG: aminotransferase class III-fold pyridoxal phosphate-dependent enzyme [Candidatus Latescibacteria bacterium]|jgi:glutamate-1-semialdehyde 2,1-aminomutase|nr:aminotransferase class III-fold pyridoxal phosphate-dependent enzyme [Candidatus Latescibacterota bacterium]
MSVRSNTSGLKSNELFERAKQAVAGGVGHDLRLGHPVPLYIERAAGARKWDVEGKEYLDYGMGNAALLLGHSPPEVVSAIREVVGSGFHFGNDHPMQVEWAELICSLVPSAERVRFVNSGSEGTMLALRVARALTGRLKVLRFEGHFSGWHDGVGRGAMLPFDQPVSAGIPKASLDTIVLIPANLDQAEMVLKQDQDIAAIMLEPSGASWGTVPLSIEFNRNLRQLATSYNVPLIYDEVISGFRYAPGGYQEFSGVTPDMSVLGKVVTGGMPGGALVGKSDIMSLFDFTGDAHHDRYERVHHLGTFNANPLAAAAGIATLRQVATGEPQEHADRLAARLRQGMDDILVDEGAAGYVYGDASTFHVYLEGFSGTHAETREQMITDDAAKLKGIPGPVVRAFQKSLLTGGIDLLSYTGGVTSAAHTDGDIEKTLPVFRETIKKLLNDQVIARLA